MGISNKIRWGFIVVGCVLFLSSMVSIFEMGRIRRSVGEIVTANVENINVSSQLLEVTDQHVFGLLGQMGISQDSVLVMPSIYQDQRFNHFLEASRTHFTLPEEMALADTIMFACAAYMQVINEAQAVWSQGDFQARRDWYAHRLEPLYMRLRDYQERLVAVEHEQLEINTRQIQDGFYRSMMPGVIAVASGIVLLFLLSYFIRLYFIKPVLQIQSGAKSALLYKKTYQLKLDSSDEINDLNETVAKLANEHNAL